MAWQLIPEANRLRIILSGEFCIPDLARLHAEWQQSWSPGMDLQMELAAVAEIDSAALQWLLFMRRWAGGKDVDCTLVEIASPVSELVKLYRLSAELGMNDPVISEEGGRPHVG